jgi:hypothetical protein
MSGRGLDVGTSYIVLSQEKEGTIEYKDFRDAFYIIKPTTPVATKMIEKGLSGKVFIKDNDGSFIILGKDAIEKAVERNDTAKRPMYRGVISSKEKYAKRILAFILKEVAGNASEQGEKLVFCVPAQPVDQEDEDFDVGYHEDVVKGILAECGYDARAINEAEALCYAELESDDYTGIAISCGAGMTNVCVMLNGEPTVTFSTTKCLGKNTKILTTESLKNISEINAGDLCYDNRGNLSKVKELLNNGFRDIMKEIYFEGYSEPIICTHDHKLWIKPDGEVNWSWIESSKVKVGDNLGLPIIKPKSRDINRAIYFYRKNNENITINKSRNFGKFLGYFLGDGSATILKKNNSDGRITCSFNLKHNDSLKNQQTYIDIVKELFDKDVSISTRTKESCNILKFNSIDIAKKLIELCYNKDKTNKQLNIDMEDIPNQMALGIIEGLLATDGWRDAHKIGFENTSSNICVLLQHLLARFGIKSNFSIRQPRAGGLNYKGQKIIGKKTIYGVSISNKQSINLLDYLSEQSSVAMLQTTQLDYISYTIQSIEDISYNDDVYDLVMDSNSVSFCCPAGALHNSGDWIDRMSAVATGEPDSVVQAEKEGGDFKIGEENDNPVLAAVSSYYERLIDYTTKQLSFALTGHRSLPKFKDPLKIVIAGGTSQAKGYIELFKQKLSDNNFPLAVKEVVHATDPLHAVSKGCLIASQVL